MTRWREAALLTAGLGAFALLCWRFGLGDFADALAQVRPGYLLLYLGLALTVFAGYSLRWLFLARTLGAKTRLCALLAARVAGDAFGSLLPTAKIGGDPLRIALVSAGGVSGPLASAGVAVDRVLELMGNMLCTVAYVTAFSLTRSAGSARETGLVLVAVMLALLAALMVPLVMLRRGVHPVSYFYRGPGRSEGTRRAIWMALVRETEDHLIHFFQSHTMAFAAGLLGTLLIEALIIAEYYFLLASFAVDLDLGTLLMAMVASGLARGIPTPAGLGAMEGAQVALFALASGRPGAGFVVGMVIRLHESFWVAVGLTVLAVRGFSLVRLLRSTGRVLP